MVDKHIGKNRGKRKFLFRDGLKQDTVPPKTNQKVSFITIGNPFHQINSGAKETNPGVEAWHESSPGTVDLRVLQATLSVVSMVQVSGYFEAEGRGRK